MDAHTSYNILLGHLSLNALNTIMSTPHLVLKFQSNVGTIITAHAYKRTTRECYMANFRLQPQTRERTPKVVHYVETGTEVAEVGHKLDPG